MEYDRLVRIKKDKKYLEVQKALHLKQGHTIKGNLCCKDPQNLRYDVAANKRMDVVVLRCRKCGARHRNAALDPGRISVKTMR